MIERGKKLWISSDDVVSADLFLEQAEPFVARFEGIAVLDELPRSSNQGARVMRECRDELEVCTIEQLVSGRDCPDR